MKTNTKKNIYLVVETLSILIGTSLLAVFINQSSFSKPYYKWLIYSPLVLFQGLWFYRLYIVGHEASHGKLFEAHKSMNHIFGSIILLPIMTPLNVFRKIHLYHHGFNRKDNHTSVLDTFVTQRLTPLKKAYYYFVWYLAVFFGGFFVHSLVSVFLFLFVPPKLAQKISPAFKGWTGKDQFEAILGFGLGVGLHVGVAFLFGKDIYLWTLGYPLLAFAWILSLFVYIFHYKTTVGDQVRYNVRALQPMPVLTWILINFNEHATHHQRPNIPWYDLRKKRVKLPKEFADKNQNTAHIFSAILQQLKGPRIINESHH